MTHQDNSNPLLIKSCSPSTLKSDVIDISLPIESTVVLRTSRGDHSRAGLGQKYCRRAPNATTGASDQCNSICNLTHLLLQKLSITIFSGSKGLGGENSY